MKKMISGMLVLVLLLTMVPWAAAEEADRVGLPAAGDVVEGFVVNEVGRLELVGADTVLFTHEKTGAQLLYIANDDTNRLFEITFRTPALDDTGTPHVFEHSTLDGSEKYPARSLFFNLSYQTYNTYMNALTDNFMTTYPVASLSEEQLLAYADYYTDSCLNPILMRDESIFREEAWRYSLEDPEGELTLTGTVYSEMLGVMDLSGYAYLNYMKTAFPGSTKANESGGLPEAIPDLTYEALCSYHDAYYHPSNSLTCLYGSFRDYTAFLKLLDGYFSAYEKKEIVITDDGYTPITGSVTVRRECAMEAGASTENTCIVYYGFVCGDLPEEDFSKLDLLTTLLSDSSSYMAQTMKERFPAGSFSCYVDNTTPETSVAFVLTGVNEEDAESFRAAVDACLAVTARDGFDADSVSAVAANTRMSVMLVGESSSLGINLIPYVAYYWALTGDTEFYSRSIAAMDHFEAYNENGAYSEIISRVLLGNERNALCVTVPAPGLKEEQDAALADRLAQIKAGMSEEELAVLAAQTAALAEPAAEDASAYVAQLQAVTVSSLPEEARIYDITESSVDGIRYLTVDANADGVSRTAVLLDADGFSTPELLTLQLYLDLMGELDTPSHTRTELSSLSNRWLYGGTIKVSLMECDDEDGIHPYLRMGFTALDAELTEGFDLLHELLYESNVTDVQRLSDVVANLKTGLKREIEASAYAINIYRAMGTSDPAQAASNYLHYLDYYEYLCRTEELLRSDPDAVVAALQAVQEQLCNAQGAIVYCVGNRTSTEAGCSAAQAFLSRLDRKTVEPVVHSFPVPDSSEAMILNTAVQYNLIYASYEDLGIEGRSGGMDAVAALMLDAYLLPMLRDRYGVYDMIHGFTNTGVYLESYRDPNISETFAVYDEMPAAVSAMDLTQEEVDNYILSAYSAYALGSGELTGGEQAVLNLLDGHAQEEKLEWMHSLKNLTAEECRTYADMYAALMEKGLRMTAGSASAINANADLYDVILDPFGAADTVLPEDLTTGTAYAQAALICREAGVMEDLRANCFGVDAPLTKGDLAAALYAAVGGACDPEEGFAMWSSYGVMSGSPEDILTREELACIGMRFLQAVGAETEEIAPEGFADADQITEGCESALGFAVGCGLMLPAGEDLLAPQAEATRGEAALYLAGILG